MTPCARLYRAYALNDVSVLILHYMKMICLVTNGRNRLLIIQNLKRKHVCIPARIMPSQSFFKIQVRIFVFC